MIFVPPYVPPQCGLSLSVFGNFLYEIGATPRDGAVHQWARHRQAASHGWAISTSELGWRNLNHILRD